MKFFKKILIANRGEIAVRVICACKELGIKTVAVFSDIEREALHVTLADESICIGPANPANSYLSIPAILSAAELTDSEAIHPGYGFLSENPQFAEACATSGITFIGPSAESMKIVMEEDELVPAFFMAQREALAAFGNGEVYIEKYLPSIRHIEVQILSDGKGNIIHLGERDCSVQRRHQKLIEESPSPVATEKFRKKLGELAVRVAKAVKYKNAGTVEFIVDKEQNIYFMEMNARVQVEHPVTEELTGIDIVKEQIKIAAGLPLTYKQSQIKLVGHAMECRINAEDPDKFIPSPGKLTLFLPPGGPGVRVDTAAFTGWVVPPHYDSMIAKLVVRAKNREDAIAKMKMALDMFIIEGI